MIKLFEKYNNVKEVKDEIFLKAIGTNDLEIIEFFLKKGYDINSDDAIENASYNDKVFRYFLKKGADINKINSYQQLHDLDVQKALIDFGHEVFVHEQGFNPKLEYDKDYSNVVDKFDSMSKYNF
jgi:ankyrin repeat protein